ncbi:Peroxisomal ATPase pex1 [Geodia barretti]|uniref:Peroxisomal ATPase PEX1 n=1 Tax=Geodia barretti TaxID=519541 RepID=A0AA35W4E8_GEOBA|nr:Peroxisomal ATPase pex1 [Geodia barretti]
MRVSSVPGVYIVAATSRPDMIDPALLRPGRIDKSILCDYPNEEERLDILKALTRSMHLESRASLAQIAQSTPHYTGADLKAVLYSAQLRAAHRVLDMEKMNEKKREVSPSEKDASGTTVEGGASVKVYKLSSGQCTEQLPQPELQKQVETLHELSRGSTQKWNNNHQGGGERKRRRVKITLEDLTVALEDVKPSLLVKERQRLADIYDKFAGKIPQTLKAVVNQRATMA